MAKAKDPAEEMIENETQAELEEIETADMEVETSDENTVTEDETEEVAPELDADGNEVVAKAGKRSRKAIAEAAAEEARQAAKEDRHEDDAPKVVQRSVPNPKNAHGKKYRAALETIDRTNLYSLEEGLDLAQSTSTTKFDGTIELHINLGVDPRQADQMVRATVILPAGTGKSLRIAAFVADSKVAEAKAAGADIAGEADLLKAIEAGKLDFDVLIATPDMMAKLGKAAKVLGPRGLMPNPKSGTVTPDIAKAIAEAKAGKVEFRIDKSGIIHQAIGKASFAKADLRKNADTLLSAILKAKPASTKGTYVKAITIASSMGPGIKLDAAATISALSTKK
ncbi:MAG: 50S ribosomal protein L1 [Candidatus Saccharibacteria bacterium]